MSTVKIRNVVIGEGMPKICVPIVGKTKEDILKAAAVIKDTNHHIVEWRVDWFEDAFDFDKVAEVLNELRVLLEDTPLLFTFRTANEGGERAIDRSHYLKLNLDVISLNLIDIIDVELFSGDDIVSKIVTKAHANNVAVIASNHDFNKTPDKDEILERLIKMQKLGADIPKIAVMPTCKKDVITLLAATEEMATNHNDTPIITMSMGSMGLISRLCGEAFGSALTFGAIGKTSAPGQMNAADLSKILSLIHEYI